MLGRLTPHPFWAKKNTSVLLARGMIAEEIGFDQEPTKNVKLRNLHEPWKYLDTVNIESIQQGDTTTFNNSENVIPSSKQHSLGIPYVGFQQNGGTPKSSMLIGFFIINHPCWGSPFLEISIFCHDPTRGFSISSPGWERCLERGRGHGAPSEWHKPSDHCKCGTERIRGDYRFSSMLIDVLVINID